MIVYYRLLSDSPNMQKISLLLEELNLPHNIEIIDPYQDPANNAELYKISPTGTVPAIFDTETGVSLFESGAILYYLAEKTKRLLPLKIADRANVIKWLMFEVSNIGPTMIELHHYYLNETGDLATAVISRYKNMLVQYCSILNSQLDGQEFLTADYSIADLAIYPWMVIIEDLAEIELTDYPNLKKWAIAIENRYSN